MAYRLGAQAVSRAIKHLTKFGDTDVFPHLPELHFARDCSADVVKALCANDLDSYVPHSACEALGPKSRFGFRIVHQLPIDDTILLLACVIEIGSRIEKHRLPFKSMQVFSYRFEKGAGASLFSSDRTYKHWLKAQQKYVQDNLRIKQIVATDISDFYARVNFHRLENLLDEVAPGNGAARYIKKHIRIIRAKQSFGLPVGGSAARILAELALADADRAVRDNAHDVTRFVDDYRIFLTSKDDPYEALAFIAEQLAISEGLALNASKTRLFSRSEFLKHIGSMVSDINEEAEDVALDSLTSNLYFDDDPDPDELEQLKSMNLLEFLQKEVGKDPYDVGKIKVIFRALKIAKPAPAIKYIIDNFDELVVFAKEMTLLMQALDEDNFIPFDEMTDTVVAAILRPPASSVQLIRTWLLELLVRGTVPINARNLKKLEGLTSALDRRQIHLIRGRAKDKSYFRKLKTSFSQLSPFERHSFIWGASCLPRDEYENWLHTIKPMMQGVTTDLFLGWVKAEQQNLVSKLSATADDHEE